MMVPFIGQAYQHRSLNVSAQRTINMYPELIDDQNAKSKYILLNRPGTELYLDFSSVTNGACRGTYTVASVDNIAKIYTSRTFTVCGNKLIEVTGTTTFEVRATISELTSRISFCDTGDKLVLVDGVSMYIFDLETNTISSPELPFLNPSKVVFLDGRVICINTDETVDVVKNYNKFYYSALGDPDTWGGADWYNASGSADPITSLSKRQGEVWLFGTRSYEVWRTSPNADSPYSKVGGSVGEIGCGAVDSVADIAENVFWLGSSKAGKNQIYASNGYNAQRISTHAIEQRLNDSGKPTTDAISWTYQLEGHTFYVITFISVNQTWQYDLSTKQWSEVTTREAFRNVENRFAPIFATFGNNEILLGSLDGPYLLKMSTDVYTDYTNQGNVPIIKTRQSPTYWNELSLMYHREFQVDMETGVGLQNGQGSKPRAMLQYSDDGGHTWSLELWVDIGAVGKYRTRARWRRLGRARNRVYRVKVSDPVPVRMSGAKLIADKGRR